MRNLMGQLDGTANVNAGFERLVWDGGAAMTHEHAEALQREA